ncbi:DUF4097 family beta strand repeat-containing protein [Sutcliffiella cohnii]|uniref:DUF4097 family beta strand repeat-containing protein n=1 Tax=Sutcliffiella cohnii TaxID=33932 RepID=UPI002E21CAE8|nr:DUF4097 family beta strand repeat-containing protein [Sutcliffiella cohnii]
MKRYTFFTLLICLFLLAGCQPSEGEEMNVLYEFDEGVERVDTIFIAAPSTKLFVETSEAEKITVELKGVFSGTDKEKENLLKTEISGEVFQVNIKPPISKKWIEEDLELHITIPDKYYEQIKVEVTSKPMELGKLNAKLFQLNSTSGDHFMSGINAESFQIEATSGDIEILDFTGEGNIEMTSGDVFLNIQEITEPISISNTSGDIHLNVASDAGFFLNTNIRKNRTEVEGGIATRWRDETKNNGEINNPPTSGPTIHITTNSGRLLIGKME